MDKWFSGLFATRATASAPESVVVIGLGRFGRSVAAALMQLGHEVMGIDKHAEVVREWAPQLTHAIQADSTSVETLRELGVGDFAHAIVAIDVDLAPSLLTVMALTELKVADIWVKAITPEHGRIAQRIGAHHLVSPEADMSARIAHLISGRMMDYIEFDDGFALAKVRAPDDTHGRTLAQAGVREHFGVTVVGIQRAAGGFHHATPESTVRAGDLLIVAGPTAEVEAFAAGRQARRSDAG